MIPNLPFEHAGVERTPFLSVIIPAKNDGFMGNFNYRIETTLNVFAHSLQTLGLLEQVEILISDWGSTVPLCQVLNLSPIARTIVRYVIIPPKIAVERQLDAEFPIVLAQNSAIRRSRGEYVMQTDSDVLFTTQFLSELFSYLKGYRPELPDPKKALIFSKRKHIPWKVAANSPDPQVLLDYAAIHHQEMTMDFHPEIPYCATGMMMLHRDLWNETSGYDERLIHWGWMEIDLGMRVTSRYPYVDLTEKLGMMIYHLEHYKGSDGKEESGRVQTRKSNPMITNNAFRPNSSIWGLADCNLEIFRYALPPTLLLG